MVARLVSSSLALALALIGFACAGANAADRTGAPRFLLTTGGPIAPVRVLAFTPDSQSFVSAGYDKLARVWSINQDDRRGLVEARVSQRLFWEISRGIRGQINTMSVSPNGKYIAIAGACARDGNGNIYIFHLGRGELDAVLRGHVHAVGTLQYSPDGKRLVSSSNDGEVRVWSTGNWNAERSLRKASGSLVDPQPVQFLSDRVVAVAARVGSSNTRWQIVLYNLATKRRIRSLDQPHSYRVMAIARDGDSTRWASSDQDGNVFLWSGVTNPTVRRLRRQRTAANLVFAGDHRLFVTTFRDKNEQTVLELWNTRERKLIDQVLTSEGEDNFACAVSPNKDYVVTYAGDHSQLWLWRLKDERGRLLAKPLSDGRKTRLGGDGRKVWKVAFDEEDTYRIGLGTKLENPDAIHRGPVTKAFDLKDPGMIPLDDDSPKWRSYRDGSDGWSISRDEDMRILQISKGGTRGRIELDHAYQGRVMSYCWLFDRRGETYGVALGTDEAFGVFVYGLPRNGRCPLLRYFRDHNGWVTSLSVSSDGKYLASGSIDGTVKIWSLEGVQARGVEFKRENAWGATFKPGRNGDGLIVEEVLEAGITARRGIEVGDKINRIRYLGRDGTPANADRGAEMLRALERNPIWQSVLVSFIPKGSRETDRVLIVPGWEPMMTLYVDRQDEWALWSPQGYYDSSVAGDEMFGWILNSPKVSQPPRFLRADRLRKQLERPEIMRRLLVGGNVPDAAQRAKKRVPVDLQVQVERHGKKLPEVRIIRPQNNSSLARDQPIETIAKVVFSDQRDVPDYKLAMYVNGIPAGEPKEKKVDGKTAYFAWQMLPPSKHNVVRVVAENDEEKHDSNYSDYQVTVRADTTFKLPPELPRLHIVSLAAEDYPGGLRLQFTIDDIEDVIKLLKQQSGKNYRIGKVVTLKDHQITRDNVENLAAKVFSNKNDVSPNDLLVIHLCGHGVALSLDSNYYFLPPGFLPPGTKSFDISDEDNQAIIRKEGISWKHIRSLANTRCRKVFMIDTCFQSDILRIRGGNAADHLIQKYSVRPLRRSEALVLTGCGLGQQSLESDELGTGHGLFTWAIMEALQGYADGYSSERNSDGPADGTVELKELVEFVKFRVPQLAKQAGERQVPTVSRSYLGFVPLGRGSE